MRRMRRGNRTRNPGIVFRWFIADRNFGIEWKKGSRDDRIEIPIEHLYVQYTYICSSLIFNAIYILRHFTEEIYTLNDDKDSPLFTLR